MGGLIADDEGDVGSLVRGLVGCQETVGGAIVAESEEQGPVVDDFLDNGVGFEGDKTRIEVAFIPEAIVPGE